MFPCRDGALRAAHSLALKDSGSFAPIQSGQPPVNTASWRWGILGRPSAFRRGGWPAAIYRVARSARSRQHGLRRDGSLAPIREEVTPGWRACAGRALKLRSPCGDNTGTYGSGTNDRTSGPGGENVMFMGLTESNIEAGDRVELSSQSLRSALPWRPKTTATSRTAGSQPQPPTP